MKFVLLLICLLLGGCLGMPGSVRPVTGFEPERYWGTWYEIARLDHPFERGLSQVTAEYRPRDDGGVSVLNRGFSEAENRWQEAQGKAFFVNNPSEGHLKVSFFGPFYGSYVIFGLDREHYRYAFVCGPNTRYLWLLSRTPTAEPEVIETFIRTAKAGGFDTDALIFVKQDVSAQPAAAPARPPQVPTGDDAPGRK